MSFEHDVFVSYAHVDNESPIEGELGWVSNFSRALKIRVGQLLGRDPIFWRDPELPGNEHLDEALLNRVTNVAALVTIVSPRYLQSEWCTRERNAFVAAAEDTTGLRIDGVARLFKVVKTPVLDDENPEALRGLFGYRFLEIDKETGRERELDAVFGPDALRKFWPKLDDLAHEMCRLIQTVQPLEPVIPTNLDDTKPVVYLAQVGADLTERYDTIRRDLRR